MLTLVKPFENDIEQTSNHVNISSVSSIIVTDNQLSVAFINVTHEERMKQNASSPTFYVFYMEVSNLHNHYAYTVFCSRTTSFVIVHRAPCETNRLSK